MLKLFKKIFSSASASPQATLTTEPIVEISSCNTASAKARGNALLAEGNFVEAEKCYLEALSINSANAEAHINLAYVLTQQNRGHDAVPHLERAVEIDPGNADGFYMLATLARDSGRLDQAIEYFDKALALNPRFQTVYGELSQLLLHCGKGDLAKPILLKAIQQFPEIADFHYFLGNLLFNLNRHSEALQRFDQALEIEQDHVPALSGRVAILIALQRNQEALDNCERLTRLLPNSAEAFLNKSAVLQSLKRYGDALESCTKALLIKPGYADALINQGTALIGLKRYEDALASYEHALEIQPGYLDAVLSRSTAFHKLKRYEESVASWPNALDLHIQYVEAFFNRGHALMSLNRFDEAIGIFSAIVKLEPSRFDAYYNESLCRLKIGDYARGWELYEWRWKNDQYKSAKRNFVQPLWLGKSSLRGKAILIHHEQGLGDTIQFCRYVALVAALGATVYLLVQKPLLSLLSNLAGVAQILTDGQDVQPFDFHCPLLSLPLALRTSGSTIPCAIPYLTPAEELVTRIQGELKSTTGFKVGVCWKGGADYLGDAERSPGIAPFKELVSRFANKEIKFYSLLPDHRDEFVRMGGEDLGYDLDTRTAPFAETAALIMNLDLVITCDTSIGHVAGALGKPVWLLLPFHSDWRWIADRESSAWYPHTRLFQQQTTGDWPEVFERVSRRFNSVIDGHTELVWPVNEEPSLNVPETESVVNPVLS